MKLPSIIYTEIDSRPDRIGDDWDKKASHWRCRLSYNGRHMTVLYSMGSAHTGTPDVKSVIGSLFSDAWAGDYDSGTFESFCSDLGYSADSRKAENIYNACLSINIRLRKLLGDDFDAMGEWIREQGY